MKSLKTFLVGLSALVALSACAAEGLVTLTVQGIATNEVQIAVNQQATVKTYLESGVQPTNGQQGNSRLRIVKDGKTIEVWSSHFYWSSPAIVVAGPATVQLVAIATCDAMATVDITPAAYPPDRAVMGWFRFVCSNGLVVGVTQSDVRRRHVGDLSSNDVGWVLAAGSG